MQLVKWTYAVIAACIAVWIFISSLQWLSPSFEAGFLSDKQTYFYNGYHFAFYAHIYTTPLLCLLGFIPYFRKPKDKLHRFLGKIYAYLVLFVSAPSALFMSMFALGGNIGVTLFLALTLLWIYSTYRAVAEVKKGRIDYHELFIKRSLILMLSGVNLRIIMFIFAQFWEGDPIQMYLLASFLSWVPFLVLHEAWVLMKRRKLNLRPIFVW